MDWLLANCYRYCYRETGAHLEQQACSGEGRCPVVPLVFKTSLGAVRFPEGSTPSLLRQIDRHSSWARHENRLQDLPGFVLDLLEMFLTAHAFCVNFAQVFSSRRAHGEPAVL
jgi:hypothetical protein